MLRCALCLLLAPSAGLGATYYVDNRVGDDSHDGGAPETPVATIARVVALSATSDTIVLRNTGIVYREAMVLGRRGGTPEKPFVVEGGGAVLSGLRIIGPDEWKKVGDDVYFFPVKNRPYGNSYLANDGERLPAAKAVDALGSEEFFWDGEAGVYFRCGEGKTPADYALGATLLGSGFATAGGSYVTCRNLVCEHFANDGFNMHGDCRGICLENVVARYNGDDGISIHEVGGLVVRGAHVHHNRFGLQDVNASRSLYNGVVIEHNSVGASFCGGFHSLVDCLIRGNASDQIDLSTAYPKHLIGAEHNPICRTTLFCQNVVVQGDGSRTGLRVRSEAVAVVEHSVITGSEEGVTVYEGGVCHLTTSVIADCPCSIASESTDVFGDYNVYQPGVMKWLGTSYGPEQWDAFRGQALHDEHSRIGPVTVAEDGTVTFPPGSAAEGVEKGVGPTAPVVIRLAEGTGPGEGQNTSQTMGD